MAELRVVDSYERVDAVSWDALCGADDPFVEHAFLLHLERSGSVGREAGCVPRPVLLYEGERLVGAMPVWLKSDSYGEYIFDWGWADAARRSGIPYYPKVVVYVPYTPATGPRLLVHPEVNADAVRAALASALPDLTRRLGAWSSHVLFTGAEDQTALTAAGRIGRSSYQFHWTNPGYVDFNQFLGALQGRRRKEVRRERSQAAASGLRLAMEPGTALSDDDLVALRACYLNTIEAHGAIPYLTEAWFLGLREHLGHRLQVATARDGDRLVAMALGFQKGGHLFGRYWGSLVDVPALHFELCYYQYLDHAIRSGLRRVEAGAQGEHKLARGYLPSLTTSVHDFVHPGLREAVAGFVTREAVGVERTITALAERGPFQATTG